ncbi:hypothetical protein E4U61_004420 [Claviceps capensis]|nr:hypothetical protein E4U61_004420 [Claviceps capensis]
MPLRLEISLLFFLWHRAYKATREKFVEDVFEKGDLFYHTGDALRRDGNGHWYFVDRLGCAAIALRSGTIADTFDWAGLAALLRKELPSYAVPIFVGVREGGLRAVGGMSTGNHKHNKAQLREGGVCPRTLGTKVAGGEADRLFWMPAGAPAYVILTEEEWERVTRTRARI